MTSFSEMDQPISIQRASKTADGIGGTTVAWATIAAAWAKVTPRVGRESMVEGRMTAVNPVTFTIYNRADISELDRIVWGGEAYNIRNIMRRGGGVLTLDIDAERGVAS